MAKKVKIMQSCIITNDDKGQRTLVGKAKEALTTFSKNKIDVYIALEDGDKEAVESFLKDNNVPYKAIVDDADKEKYDITIIPDNNVILLRDDWTWCLSNLVEKLYDNREKPAQKSEQEKMDERFKDYKRWADEANKRKKSEGIAIG